MEKSILVVDDDAAVLELIEDFLLSKDYRVITAKNGEEALKKYDSDFNGLVITDMDMPGMTGIELLESLKKRDPDCVGIILTGHGTMETCIQSLREGLAYDYLLKPLKHMDLLLTSCNRASHEKELEIQNRTLLVSLKKANEELIENLDQLKKTQNELVESKRSEALLEMAINVAHEVNNPLCCISNNVQLMMMEMDKANQEYESLQKIQEYIQRISDFVKSIQDIRNHKHKIDPHTGGFRDD